MAGRWWCHWRNIPRTTIVFMMTRLALESKQNAFRCRVGKDFPLRKPCPYGRKAFSNQHHPHCSCKKSLEGGSYSSLRFGRGYSCVRRLVYGLLCTLYLILLLPLLLPECSKIVDHMVWIYGIALSDPEAPNVAIRRKNWSTTPSAPSPNVSCHPRNVRQLWQRTNTRQYALSGIHNSNSFQNLKTSCPQQTRQVPELFVRWGTLGWRIRIWKLNCPKAGFGWCNRKWKYILHQKNKRYAGFTQSFVIINN